MCQVIPWGGLDSARFGENRETLRERFGEFNSFVRAPGTPPIDHYVEVGSLLSFDTSDRLVFIEATDRAELTFAGVRLSGRPFGKVLADLSRNGVDVEIDDSGGVLDGTGIALYTPAPDEPDIEVEGVAIFSLADAASDTSATSVEPLDAADEDTLF